MAHLIREGRDTAWMPSISDAVVDDAPIYLTGGALEVAVQAIPVDTQQIEIKAEKRAMRHLVYVHQMARWDEARDPSIAASSK
ncbi:hypothetical protein AtubIFM55763_002607 [Aspergillus tubingensis]|nr:hypothetical protein AtubIFM55763_002607 [Aspergillus tubingensis]GLB22957.1 hypothetical protein AtubIFM61612_003540 [Aspergillus tubingensis]